MRRAIFFAAWVISGIYSSISYGATYGGGSGTAADPYQIWTPEQMNTIGANSVDWGKCFKLMSDIDMSAYTGTQYKIIGNSTKKFTGTFDGNGQVVRNLTYTTIADVDFVGLFGYVYNNATIRNLGVENVLLSSGGGDIGGLVGFNNYGTISNCYVTGIISGSFHVGGLVGNNDGNINNCHVTGTVNGSQYIGGLVGKHIDGTISNCHATGTVNGYSIYNGYIGGLVGCNEYGGTITSCYTTATVSGTGYYAGGLVGYDEYGTITSCYSTGDVSVTGDRVGGLIGYSEDGTITSCYATGSVNVTGDYVGGLVGWSFALFSFCYATGTVSGTGYNLGGLAGLDDGLLKSCFWDVQMSGQSGTYGGKGLSTIQMKTISTYQNGDWANNGWVMKDGIDYPRLSWENTGGSAIPSAVIPFAGTGTVNDPYLISTAQEFSLLSWYSGILNKQIKLTANLDLSGFLLYPIGDLGRFTGVFDGNGHTISNAVITRLNGDNIGIFGYTGGQIKNLGVVDANIQGRDTVGILAGKSFAAITSCYTTGTVSGHDNVGGLVGDKYSGTISSCYATATVSGSGQLVGGLVGCHEYGTTTSCYATGAVNGSSPVGGLIGSNFSGTVTSSFWNTQTSGKTTSAGGTGKTTAQMQSLSTFTSAGWDFTTIWDICEGTNYPRLQWQIPDGDFACPDGVNAEDLSVLSACWMETVEAKADIDANGSVNLNDYVKIAQQWMVTGCGTCGGADITGDGNVDDSDFTLLAQQWLLQENVGCQMADLNDDDEINLADYAIFARHWLEAI